MLKYVLSAVFALGFIHSAPTVAFDDFVESDLDFVDSQFKADVVSQLNRMVKTIDACGRGIGTVYQEKNSANPANPEFSVPCGNMSNRSEKSVVYFFSWLDAVNKKEPYTKSSISYGDAAKLCRAKAETSAKHSSSARLTDIVFKSNQDGTATMAATLKAKNDFGVFFESEVRCMFDKSKLTKFEIF